MKINNTNQMWQLSQDSAIAVLDRQSPDVTSILIVEDDEIIAKQLRYLLNKFEYSILDVLKSGEELIEKLNYLEPDVLIMDIELSGELDGISAVEKLQKQYKLPVIYLSAKTDRQTLRRAQYTNPFGYLTKPINPIELRFTIELAKYKHRTEQKLQTQREWLKTTLTSIGDGVISTDNNGVVTFINPSAETGLQIKSEAILNRKFYSILNLVDDDSNAPVDPVEQAIQQDCSIQFNNHTLQNKATGYSLPVDCTVVPLYNSKNQLSGSIIIFRDISQRKKDYQEKSQLEAQLRHAQKMEAIGQLTSGIAHEFNNILTGISSYTELAQAELPPEDPIQRYHRTILKKLDQAVLLTRKLLTFSRNEDLHFQTTDLNIVIDNHLHFLQQTIRDGVIIEADLDSNIGLVNADVNALEQIITNLCLNARDAIADYGTIELHTEQYEITANPQHYSVNISPGSYVKFTVKDNGAGMDEETRQKIFEPFFTTKDDRNGTGLGLSIVYGLVEQHHGWINCISYPQIGTIFELYFPATQP